MHNAPYEPFVPPKPLPRPLKQVRSTQNLDETGSTARYSIFSVFRSVTYFGQFSVFSIKDCTMFGEFVMDGYVCEALPPSSLSPSDILSKYLSRPVHLMMKGPQPRACPPTMAFPTLKATTKFQVHPSLARQKRHGQGMLK